MASTPATDPPPPEFGPLQFRVGESLGTTLYVQLGPEPSKSDPDIGTMNNPRWAAHVVDVLNRAHAPAP